MTQIECLTCLDCGSRGANRCWINCLLRIEQKLSSSWTKKTFFIKRSSSADMESFFSLLLRISHGIALMKFLSLYNICCFERWWGRKSWWNRRSDQSKVAQHEDKKWKMIGKLKVFFSVAFNFSRRSLRTICQFSNKTIWNIIQGRFHHFSFRFVLVNFRRRTQTVEWKFWMI